MMINVNDIIRGGTMSELKPCPFCGSEANMLGDYDYSNYHANCTNDECGCYWVACYETEQEAIEAWNRRAYED